MLQVVKINTANNQKKFKALEGTFYARIWFLNQAMFCIQMNILEE